MKTKIILLIIILLCFNCDKEDTPLFEAMDKLEGQMSSKDLKTFIKAEEKRCFNALKFKKKLIR